jgi:hypothetical protein
MLGPKAPIRQEKIHRQGLSSCVKSLLKSTQDRKGEGRPVETLVFYGNAGQGHGSRIKGHDRRNTNKMQECLKRTSTMVSTNEYLSSKLCCLCDSRMVHSERKKGGTNLGVVVCIKRQCPGWKNGFAARGRDQNAAINIAKIGLYEKVMNTPYPSFSPTLQPQQQLQQH